MVSDFRVSPESGDAEDLWDFGTVRHGGKPSTIGRSQNSVRVSGPPLTWENNGSISQHDRSPPSPARRTSGSSSYNSSMATKGDLPPLPPPGTSNFEQSTIRHMPSSVEIQNGHSSQTAEQHLIDEYDDYDDQYVDTYSSSKAGMLHQKMQEMHLEEDLPDTTMLDSVILPAIASVRFVPILESTLIFLPTIPAIPQGLIAGSKGGFERPAESIH